MANLKSLAKDTAIYGLSSIVARFINYLLVPLQTRKFVASGGAYGIVTEVYAYVALLIVLLTYGMETTFFRFMNREGENPRLVYSTALRMVGFTSLLFAAAAIGFGGNIARWMGYGDHPEYVVIMFVTVAIDAFTALLFAYLRQQHRPIKFATLKILNIGLNIGLNLLYLVLLPITHLNPFGIYDDGFTPDVVWVFRINLFCTICTLLMLWKELRGIRGGFSRELCKKMLAYTWPLLVMGLAGQLNQCASQILFPHFYSGNTQEAHAQLGIYGACIKIAMIMVMITQAFRFAYEPFVFGKSRDSDNRQTYAQAMKFYLIFTLLAFLVVMGYLDVFKHIIDRSYWEGLRVVPIVMAAEIMFGVFFNLSFWYKLTDRTIWGAWFSGLGAVILFAVDIALIPRYSYMACAWAGFAAYGVSMLISYGVGQHYYPIRYPLRSMAVYVVIAALFFTVMQLLPAQWPVAARLAINTVLIGLFVGHILYHDLPLQTLLNKQAGKHCL